MKAKLTVTVDRDVILAAKRTAAKREVSLSALIEQALRDAIAADGPSFADKWRGKFKLARRTGPRMVYLRRKYGL